MTRIRRTRWLALGIWLATLTMMVLTIVLSIGDQTTTANDLPIIFGFAVGMLAFGTIGAVIATQAPRNPIGWLYETAAFGAVLSVSASGYAIRALGYHRTFVVTNDFGVRYAAG